MNSQIYVKVKYERKIPETIPKYLSLGYVSNFLGTQEVFETAMLNEPSVFEPLKFDTMYFTTPFKLATFKFAGPRIPYFVRD